MRGLTLAIACPFSFCCTLVKVRPHRLPFPPERQGKKALGTACVHPPCFRDHAETQKTPRTFCSRELGSGSDLLSRAVSSQVPSALRGLTSVFGMGTGVTLSSLPPEIVNLFLSDSSRFPCFCQAFSSALFRSFSSHPDNCTAS